MDETGKYVYQNRARVDNKSASTRTAPYVGMHIHTWLPQRSRWERIPMQTVQRLPSEGVLSLGHQGGRL